MFDIKLGDDGSVFLVGRLDASQVNKAESVLDGLSQSVTADMSKLSYISSAGIGIIVKTHQRLNELGHDFRIANASGHVKTVFHYAGLDAFLQFVDED